jgi:hypothetical protein
MTRTRCSITLCLLHENTSASRLISPIGRMSRSAQNKTDLYPTEADVRKFPCEFITLHFSILLHCIVQWVLQVMFPSACSFIVCWFPLSFTTCFGLHGHHHVCRILPISDLRKRLMRTYHWVSLFKSYTESQQISL